MQASLSDNNQMEASGERADAAQDNNLFGLPVIAQRRRKGSALGERYRQRLHCLRLDWKLAWTARRAGNGGLVMLSAIR